MLTPEDIRHFRRGTLRYAYRKLGAHLDPHSGQGAHFATWAPHAERVSVVGSFNDWDGRRNAMQRVGASGVWQLYIAGVAPGAEYKFEIKNRDNGQVVIRTDPYARAFRSPGNTNAIVTPTSQFRWSDQQWMQQREQSDWRLEPISIYEVHAGSWRRSAAGSFLRYPELARELAAYVSQLGCTHIELLPIYEHPLHESLGYQITGFYAPSSRFGNPDEFRFFINYLHNAGIGVILDWVPLHFPKDEWALVQFDGAPLYERDDSAMAEHPTWQTLIFNYGRPEVRNFLLSNALYWLDEFHADGLRVDAVSSMIYLDDARAPGWRPNPLGGRESLAAIRFLREFNSEVNSVVPSAITIAEESTDFPKVSDTPQRGGLGFAMKWDMGWVNDTLRFMRLPWEERPHHHRDLTFGRLYAEKERFVLSFSHDEVMPGKGSLYQQMYGDDNQKLAALRALLCYQFTYPGKKLNFMGNEFGQPFAWNGNSLVWDALQTAPHRKLASAFADLNGLYRNHGALRASDFSAHNFEWIEADDAARSSIAYVRRGSDVFLIVVLNFSSAMLTDYAIAVPSKGFYEVIFDSDAPLYGGAGQSVLLSARAVAWAHQRFEQAVSVTLAPLSGLIIALQESTAAMVA